MACKVYSLTNVVLWDRFTFYSAVLELQLDCGDFLLSMEVYRGAFFGVSDT